MSDKKSKLLFAVLSSVFVMATSMPAQADSDKTDVFTFMNADGTPAAGDVVGHARLSRSDKGINLTLKTSHLGPGAAYSIWWVIFNNPGACDQDGTPGCSDTDFATAEVEASVLNATGRVADGYGRAKFSATLPAGQILTEPASGTVRHAFGPGLQNVRGAEVHVVVRCHGPATGSVEQISTLFADCVADDGAGNLVCFDAQAAVFPLPKQHHHHR